MDPPVREISFIEHVADLSFGVRMLLHWEIVTELFIVVGFTSYIHLHVFWRVRRVLLFLIPPRTNI